jgi:hypothetical protein
MCRHEKQQKNTKEGIVAGEGSMRSTSCPGQEEAKGSQCSAAWIQSAHRRRHYSGSGLAGKDNPQRGPVCGGGGFGVGPKRRTAHRGRGARGIAAGAGQDSGGRQLLRQHFAARGRTDCALYKSGRHRALSLTTGAVKVVPVVAAHQGHEEDRRAACQNHEKARQDHEEARQDHEEACHYRFWILEPPS